MTNKNLKTGDNNSDTSNFFPAETNLFSAILHTLQEPLFLFDTGFKMVWHNKACNELYQYVSGKPIDSSFDFNELLTKEQQPIFHEQLNKVLLGEKNHFEWKYKQSITKWLSVSLYPFTAGNFKGICGSLMDITEKKINELALLRNTAVLNNISDAVIYTDTDQRVAYFNKSAEKIYHIAAGEIIGRVPGEMISYEYIEDTKENAEQILAEKGEWQGKLSYKRKDGKTIYLLASMTRFIDKHGNAAGLITTNKDITEEEQSRQESLRHQQNKKAIISNIREGVILADRNFTILSFNQRASVLEKRIGIHLSIGENLVALNPESRRKPVLQYLERALKGEPIEYEVLYPDNTWLLINFLPARDDNGDISRIIITSRDITERKQAEELVSSNEKKYRTLVNSLSEGVILQTPDNKILTVNKSAERILGVSAGELIQKQHLFQGLNLIDEYENEISHDQLLFHKNGKIRFVQNKVIGLNKNGGIQWLKLNSAGVIHTKDNNYEAIAISFEDITEQKRVSGEMEILSIVAKETINAVCLLNVSGDVLWINEGFTHLTGYTFDEIVGTKRRAFMFGPETSRQAIEKMVYNRSNGLPIKEEITIYSKTGAKLWVIVEGQPIRNKSGDVIKYFTIVTNITDLRRLEEERLKREVEQQKEITRVILQTQEAQRNDLGRELHDNINQILSAVKMQLSHCLLFYDTGRQIVNDSIYNITEAMEEIRKLSHRMVMPRFSDCRLNDKLQTLIKDYIGYDQSLQLKTPEWKDEEISPAIKETFYRIVQEQLTNIHKHAKADKIIIQLKSDGERAAMIIEDNGVGFDTNITKDGIGVSNIRNRVELYNGSFAIESSPGQGCRLLVSIPLKSA